jgi:hypothetical protein
MTWYRMHDASPAGMIATAPEQARHWNDLGYGIFATVNAFSGPRRIDCCTKIRAWAIDIDEGDKSEQRERIMRSPLAPSSIVETKNGYHVYWYARTGRREFYRPLVSRLVEFFRADKNARDVARVLRVPGYRHLKDPSDPFLVRHVYGPHRGRVYLEKQMARAFPAPENDESSDRHESERRKYVSPSGDDFWDRVYNLDQMEALRRLSGSRYVGGEQYTFRAVGGGSRHNIVVDGKGSSCWIDASGRIGSADHGGPTVVQWLAWFGTPKRQCVEVVKSLFPDLCDD